MSLIFNAITSRHNFIWIYLAALLLPQTNLSRYRWRTMRLMRLRLPPVGLFLICLLAATPGPATGQEMTFADMVHDFGQLKAGNIEKCDFVFTNTGDALLVVSNVQASCGCTTVGEWTKQVWPGKTGLIPIQFNSRRVGGSIHVTITVASNDPRRPRLELKLRGKVWERIDVNPRYALFDLSRDLAPNAIQLLDITNNTGLPVTLSPPEINVANYTARITTNEPGRDYHLIVGLISPPVAGQPQGLITIRTSCQDQPILDISIIAFDPKAPSPSPAAMEFAPGDFPRLDGSQTARLFHTRQFAPRRIVFIDARNDQDYKAGHVPGALEFDPYHPDKYLATVLPACQAAEQAVVYCRGIDCDDSELAAVALRKNGVAGYKLLIAADGMNGWNALHLPLEVSAQNNNQP
jgi:rhodanese-related sulfurtransferase